jgi:hypothetical protein
MRFIILAFFLASCGGKVYIPGESSEHFGPSGDDINATQAGDPTDYQTDGADPHANGDESQVNGGDSHENGDELQSGDTDSHENDGNSICYGLITICHHPPGNNKNALSITISCKAMKGHVNHGDYFGECQ